ncbi:MAG: hypothetical protein Q3969_03220 [Moraxella sp.]|nr:hypothetical protein [Moraxella sp.]
MDTAQSTKDFLWLGHSLLTVKGDDNQEVAEKIKAHIIRTFFYFGKKNQRKIGAWNMV